MAGVDWPVAGRPWQLRRSGSSSVGSEWVVLIRKRRRTHTFLPNRIQGRSGVPAPKLVRRARFSVGEGLYGDKHSAQTPEPGRRRDLFLRRQRRHPCGYLVLIRDMPAIGNLWRVVKREQHPRFDRHTTIRRDPKLLSVRW